MMNAAVASAIASANVSANARANAPACASAFAFVRAFSYAYALVAAIASAYVIAVADDRADDSAPDVAAANAPATAFIRAFPHAIAVASGSAHAAVIAIASGAAYAYAFAFIRSFTHVSATAIAAAFVVVTAIVSADDASAQEMEILGQHKDWKTVVTINEAGDLLCAARTEAIRRGYPAALALTVDEYSYYRFAVTIPQVDVAAAQGSILLEIGDTTWTLGGAEFYPAPSVEGVTALFRIGFDPKQREFVQDVMRASHAAVLDQERRQLTRFSLAGSAAAIRQMDECRQLIDPAY